MLPYVWSYNENYTHTVVQEDNYWESNKNFAFIVDGHYAQVNLSRNTYQNNECKGSPYEPPFVSRSFILPVIDKYLFVQMAWYRYVVWKNRWELLVIKSPVTRALIWWNLKPIVSRRYVENYLLNFSKTSSNIILLVDLKYVLVITSKRDFRLNNVFFFFFQIDVRRFQAV